MIFLVKKNVPSLKKRLKTTGLDQLRGIHYQNAAAPYCLFVSSHDGGVALV